MNELVLVSASGAVPSLSEYLRHATLARRSVRYYTGFLETGEFRFDASPGSWPLPVSRALELSAGRCASWSAAIDARSDSQSTSQPPTSSHRAKPLLP